MTTALPTTIATLKQGIREGLHPGVQLFVSGQGQVLADVALGEARPGVRLDPNFLLWWRSATKPVLAVALGQLKEKGALDWDDPVVRFIPEFGLHGKEQITLRHVLTHTAGLRTAELMPETLSWGESVEKICESRPEPRTEPGRQAAYHLRSTWTLLGEVLRRVDGRDVRTYVREEVFGRLGMERSWIGLPPEWVGPYRHWMALVYRTDAAPAQEVGFWNSEVGWTLLQPGGNGRGPVRELGRFYLALLRLWRSGPGTEGLLSYATLRELVDRQRVDMEDRTFRHVLDWGLGFIPNNNRHGIATVPYGYGKYASDEAFGHSGAQCSCAFVDPAHDLVVAWACTGLPGESRHQARSRAINEAIYVDLGLTG